jgi:hypothetical protein
MIAQVRNAHVRHVLQAQKQNGAGTATEADYTDVYGFLLFTHSLFSLPLDRRICLWYL